MKRSTPTPDPRPPVAYSYIRFSTPDQLRGDSLRRQTADTEAWCRKSGISLDASLSLRDLGVSAFKGKHRSDKAALGHFLEAVRLGKVPRGSYLIIENLDRLSREEERTALRLWLDILDAGINIVQLQPETVFRHERSDMTDIIRAIIELSRGHSESKMKSVRVSAAWDAKFKRADNGEVLTRTLPAWVRQKEGRLELIPERAEAVRKIFLLASAGYGHTTIVQKVREEGVPAFGASGDWTRAYVHNILSDRRAVGELRPRLTKAGRASGHVLSGYYPAVVSEGEFLAARAATAARRKGKPGRMTGAPDGCANIFGGMLRNARDGGTYIVARRRNKGGDGNWRHHRALQAGAHDNGKSPAYSFPLEVFERAILSMLREIKPEEVLPPAGPPNDAALIGNELDYLRERKAALTEELLKGDIGAIATALRQIEARELELKDKLDAAEEEQVKPVAETWRDVRSLVDLLDGAEDVADVRLRLRSAVRRVVDEVWVFVCSSGRDRFAHVEIVFNGRESRGYWLLAKPRGGYKRGGCRPGRWWATSIKHESGDLTGLQTLTGKAREKASARFEADLIPAVRKAMEADLQAREQYKDNPEMLAEFDRETRTGVIEPAGK